MKARTLTDRGHLDVLEAAANLLIRACREARDCGLEVHLYMEDGNVSEGENDELAFTITVTRPIGTRLPGFDTPAPDQARTQEEG